MPEKKNSPVDFRQEQKNEQLATEQKQEFVKCERCKHPTNEPDAQFCETCGYSLIPSPIKRPENKRETFHKQLMGTSNYLRLKKNMWLALIFVAVAGWGFSNFTRPIGIQAEESLPEEGVLAYWSPPCGVRLVSEEIAREVDKIREDKFVLRLTDAYRDRDALEELIDGQLSLVLAEKTFLPESYEKAKAKGVDLNATRYALDGIAYIVNKRTNIEYLTIENLEKIYRGEITNWKEVGGEDRKIEPILLSGLGRNTIFLNFNGQLNPNNIYVQDREEAISILKEKSGALFYTSATLAAIEEGVNIIPLMNNKKEIILPVINGETNKKAFKKGTYPQVRKLYAIYRQEEENPDSQMVEAFKQFLVSPKGQKMVLDAGFVPLYKTLKDHNTLVN